jgi:putative Holliday junction resolvase
MPNSGCYHTLLAFDFGLKKIGIAQGQTLTKLAQGLRITKAVHGKPNWREIGHIISEWKPDLLLVGLPLNMDGSESPLSQLSRKFAGNLHKQFNLEVLMVDERLSSQAVKSTLIEDRQSNTRKRGKVPDLTSIDHLAAALILQRWLDCPELGQDL